MELTSVTKDSKGNTLMGSAEGNFDESEMKKRKMIRIIILVSAILLIIIIALVLYFCLRSNDKDSCEIENCQIVENDSKNCKCKECKPYFRLENGKCILIHSFEAIYKINPSNDEIKETKLFNVENLKDYAINKIQVDGKFIKDNSNYYKFTKEGEHKVLII